MIILGIDPGFVATGFGVLEKKSNRVHLIDYGYLSMSSRDNLSKRIGIFYSCFKSKIEKFGIQSIALETPFMGKNAQNFLKLGYLRGLLYLLSDQNSLNLFEFSPCEVKQALTGYGSARKEQVAFMIQKFFPSFNVDSKLDVTDAVAVALCGLWKSQRKF